MAPIRIPKKIHDRLLAGLKRYQPIVRNIAERDVSEADTVTVIKDILCDIFGYDKYSELTSEQQIRGTFCDLAIRVDGKVHYLCEVKSAGTNLSDTHLRQAVNYGAHQGIEWVILSNALSWKVYRLKFSQPIEWDEVYSFDLSSLTRSSDDIEKLYMLCKESISSDVLEEYHRQAQILNRYVIADLILSDAIVSCLRKEFRRLFNGLKTNDEELRLLLANEVLKRDAIDGDQAKLAKALVKKSENALRRKAAKAATA